MMDQSLEKEDKDVIKDVANEEEKRLTDDLIESLRTKIDNNMYPLW